MEINIGNSECDKSVDNYYDRNFGSHTAPAERLSTVSSPFLSVDNHPKFLFGKSWISSRIDHPNHAPKTTTDYPWHCLHYFEASIYKETLHKVP